MVTLKITPNLVCGLAMHMSVDVLDDVFKIHTVDWFLPQDVSCWVLSYYLVSCFSVLFSTMITSHGEERVDLYSFRLCWCMSNFMSFVSSSWGQGLAAVFDFGTPWTLHLTFYSGRWKAFHLTWEKYKCFQDICSFISETQTNAADATKALIIRPGKRTIMHGFNLHWKRTWITTEDV